MVASADDEMRGGDDVGVRLGIVEIEESIEAEVDEDGDNDGGESVTSFLS